MKGCALDTDGDGNCHVHPKGCPPAPAPEAKLRIRLPRRVTSDLPVMRDGDVRIVEPGVYPAGINRHGAVWVEIPDSGNLGVRPGEFEFVQESVAGVWHELVALREQVKELRRDRLALAMLAHPQAQFFNPIAAWEAQNLRDRLLLEAVVAAAR